MTFLILFYFDKIYINIINYNYLGFSINVPFYDHQYYSVTQFLIENPI